MGIGNDYAGNENNYPENIDTPADGEKANAAVFDRPHQNLADRTAWLKRRMLLAPANVDVAFASSAGSQPFGACYVPKYDELWIVGEYNGAGPNSNVWTSKNMGRSFTRNTAVDGAVVANPTHMYGIAANANGDLIIVNSAAHWQSYDRALDTWYADGGLALGSWSRIVYAPTLDKFAMIGLSTANMNAHTTNAADIHNPVAPTTAIGGAGTWNNFTNGLAVNPTTGLVVAVGLSGGMPRTPYTADAGANWTTPASLASSIATLTYVDICYSAHDGYFYMTCGDDALHLGEVWRSTDGATWTLRATLANDHIRNVQAFGERLVGVTGTNRASVVTSSDGGATWKRTGTQLGSQPHKIVNALGRAAFVCSTIVATSHYLGGDEASVALT